MQLYQYEMNYEHELYHFIADIWNKQYLEYVIAVQKFY